MGRQYRPLREWCYTCCTDHAGAKECPGALYATGQERHGWRVLVQTQFGMEIYGVLVAPSRGVWRARVLTYPNILWILPEGGSIKFVGGGPREAEHNAIAFIKHHCKTRGLEIQKKLPTVESGAVDPEYSEAIARPRGTGSNQRKLQGMPLMFGLGHVTQEAATDNFSEGGMFVRTEAPLPKDSPIQIQLELEGMRIPLSGIVQWARTGEEAGRPAGMGVRLVRPAPRYIHYVRQKLKADRNNMLPEPAGTPDPAAEDSAADPAVAASAPAEAP